MQRPPTLFLVLLLRTAKKRVSDSQGKLISRLRTFSRSFSPKTTIPSSSTVPMTAAATDGIQSPGCKKSSDRHSCDLALTGGDCSI